MTEFINRYYDNLLRKHFGIKKISKLIPKKYYESTLYYIVKDYVNRYNISLTLIMIQYKPYDKLQSLSVLIYY